jgi:2,5-diketo-D-gluconate reductase A
MQLRMDDPEPNESGLTDPRRARRESVGLAVRDSGLPREDVFLTTKLQPSDAGRERRVLEASLRALGTDYLDLWLIHAPPIEQAGVPTWWEFLALRDEGLVRSIGVSNYDIDQLDLLATATGELPAVNQVPWSPARHDPYVLDEHRERAVVLEGYSPLKGTRLSDPVLREISERHGVTPAQVVLRWHLEHGIPVIPKSATPERIASNFKTEQPLVTDPPGAGVRTRHMNDTLANLLFVDGSVRSFREEELLRELFCVPDPR